MTTKLLSAIKIAVLALALSVGLTYAYAWTSPSQQAPAGNVSAPINVGSGDQTKLQGNICVSISGITKCLGDALVTGATTQTKSGNFNIGSFISFIAGTGSTTVGSLSAGTGNITGGNVIANSLAANGLLIPTGASAGKVLTSDAIGNATWGAGGSAAATDPAPIGSIVSYAGAVAPAGYLFCDGSSLLRSAYPALFTAIGTTYGAVDASHFSLPDLRGEFVRGVDSRSVALGGLDPDGPRALGSTQADMLKNHTHLIPGGGGGGSQGGSPNNATGYIYNTSNPTSGAGPETRPKNIALNYIIKAQQASVILPTDISAVSSITAGTGITLNPAGPNATGDVTVSITPSTPLNQVFTSSGTWTKPAGIAANALVEVELWGAGGGGGHSAVGGNGGGGGGGGAYSYRRFFASDLNASEAVVIGAGGAGGTAANGGTGGTSSFGTTKLVSPGGAGGTGGGSVTLGVGGTGGTTAGFWSGNTGGSANSGNGGSANIMGGGGGGSGTYSGAAGVGGVTYGGAGGGGSSATTVPVAGSAPGGGGGGGGIHNTSGAVGGAGKCVVTITQ